MFQSGLIENGLGMTEKQDSHENKLHSRPEDPEENTRPPGNGDEDQQDTERGREKLESVLGG